MRRSLAAALVALAAVAAPASAAPPLPPKPLDWCDLAQNCVCGIVAGTLATVTGRDLLHCV